MFAISNWITFDLNETYTEKFLEVFRLHEGITSFDQLLGTLVKGKGDQSVCIRGIETTYII